MVNLETIIHINKYCSYCDDFTTDLFERESLFLD